MPALAPDAELSAVPDVVVDLTLLVGGLIVLTVGADRFVLGAARLSLLASVAPVLIGAVVIGFGTSLPELAVSGLAAVRGTQDLALSNLVGSNTANVLLVLGGGAVIRALAVRAATLRREVPVMLAGVGLFALVSADGNLSLIDAVILLVGGALALGLLIRAAVRDRDTTVVPTDVVEPAEDPPKLVRTLLLAVIGLAAVLGGAHLVVTGAVSLAGAAGVSDVVIGVTVVAVGTSLPELVTAVAAARRGEPDLVVGNVLGSNLFNVLPVAGIAALFGNARLASSFGPNLAVMVVACLIAAGLLRTGRRLTRVEGAGLLTLFVVAIVAAVQFG